MQDKYTVAQHLDKLRMEANIKIADFCEDVCSERQYSRYINGSQQIRQEKLQGFLDKLHLAPSNFYQSYYHNEYAETRLVFDVYELFNDKNYDLIKEKLDKLSTYTFGFQFARRLYEFCVIRYQYRTNKAPLLHLLNQYKELVGYPGMMKKTRFNFLDIVSLVEIARLGGLASKDYEPLEFLHSILINEDKMILSTDEKSLIAYVYFIVAQFLGKLGDNERCLNVCDKGIDLFNSTGKSYGLSSLYYFKSLVLFNTGHKEEAYRFARRSLYTDIATNNLDRYYHMSKILKKDFGIDPIEYVNINKDTKL